MSRRQTPLHVLFVPAFTVTLFWFVFVGHAAATQPSKHSLTPAALLERLKTKPSGNDATSLSDEIRNWFGKANLSLGPAPKVEGRAVAWAIEVPGAFAYP
jgi:hypothetical protein